MKGISLASCFVFLSTFFMLSCNGRPSSVIDPDKMIDVLHDIEVVQAIYQMGDRYQTPESRDSLVNGVYAKYNITQADFDSSLVWYSDNVELFRFINDSVMKRLKAESQFLMVSRPMDINLLQEYVILPKVFNLSTARSILPFRIDSFSMKTMDKQTLRFEFDIVGINVNHDVQAAMYFVYNDTVIKEMEELCANKQHYLFDKPERPDSLLKAVSGYIRMNTDRMQIPLVIYNIRYELPKDTMAVDPVAETAAL